MPEPQTSLEERVRLLRDQVQHLEKVLAQVRNQITAVQAELESSQQKLAAPAAPPSSLSSAAVTPQPATTLGGETTWPFTPPRAQPGRRRDWETVIGGNWFNKIGIGAIVLGIAFFLRYAIENQWIDNSGKVLLGIVAGLALLAGGERYQRRQLKVFARGLTGGGAAILYLALYFAFQIYQIISQPLAFALMVLVTANTVFLALRYHSRTILLFAMFGGFFTPFWVSTGVARPLALFTYITILDLGLVAVAWRQNWRFLNSLCFLATAALYFGWFEQEYRAGQFLLAETFLTVFFLIFAVLSFLIHLLKRQRTRSYDALSLAGNALFYLTGNLALFDSVGAEKYRAPFTLALAGLYGSLSLAALRRNREDALLILMLSGAAVTFLTLFFPIALKEEWVPLAWLMETFVLLSLASRLRLVALQQLGLLVGIVAWVSLLGFIFVYKGLPIETGEWLTFLLGAGGMLVCLLVQAQNAEPLTIRLAHFTLIWEILILLTLPFLLATFWTSVGLLVLGTAVLTLARLPFSVSSQPRELAFYFMPLAALVIFMREYDPHWITWQNFVPALNARFLAYIAAAALLGWQLYTIGSLRLGKSVNRLQAALLKLLPIQIILLLFFALTLDVLSFYDFRAEALNYATNLYAPQHLTLSAVWSIFSLLLLIIGISQRVVKLRLAALLIFALTIIKVAFIDFWLFDKLYRILSALIFGAVLVYASYLYQRHKDKILAAVMGTEESATER